MNKLLIINELYKYGGFASKADFAKFLGVTPQNLSNWYKRNTYDEYLLISKFTDVNECWIKTGEGEMIKPDTSLYSINQEHKGTPYYDIDFIGGFDLVENDQTQNPTYHIYFPQYNKADCWVNVTGHSMEPWINHGDIVALRRIEDWRTYMLYGEIYALVTDEYRTVKKVRKSSNDNNKIRLVPINAEYDEQDVSKDIIRAVYQVLGCAKKIF